MFRLISFLGLIIIVVINSCQSQGSNIVKTGNTIGVRFSTPNGFKRPNIKANSFAAYLVNLQLKPHGSYVYYHDGRQKTKKDVYCAVVDMEIGKENLQQCADAVMRLRGEYLFKERRYADIKFNLLGTGKPYSFSEYAEKDITYSKFRKYMDYIFAYANTASLHDELSTITNIQAIQHGDVFIQKKQPYGHAVIVLDVAVDQNSGKKIFLLGQSYMPAQDIQILINPSNSELSPWYEAKEGFINTPEWNFSHTDLKRFKP